MGALTRSLAESLQPLWYHHTLNWMAEDPTDIIESALTENVVSFWPPLSEQRRMWVLEKIRSESVSSIVDIGCGEGSLLSCLCNPGFYLDGRPSILKQGATSRVPLIIQRYAEINLDRLAGLDISSEDLETCSTYTSPREGNQDGGYMSHKRWQPLEVKLWHGSFEALNEEFQDVDCIVSTEVIEHLPPEALPRFAPILLGTYRPRLLLLTTPNYSYNARFSPPDIPHSALRETGFPDPTARTERVFRHADHKFEWTPEEFRSWCEDAASCWGYDVEVDGVGRSKQPDPWGRDEELGFASQVAIFRRKNGCESTSSTAKRLAPTDHSSHRLIATHHHAPSCPTQSIASTDEIASQVILAMSSQPANLNIEWNIGYLWWQEGLPEVCGGYLSLLLEAIVECDELELEYSKDMPTLDWIVKYVGDIPLHSALSDDEDYHLNDEDQMTALTEDEAPEETYPRSLWELSHSIEDANDTPSWNSELTWGSTQGDPDDGWGLSSWDNADLTNGWALDVPLGDHDREQNESQHDSAGTHVPSHVHHKNSVVPT